jgi:MFS family permease
MNDTTKLSRLPRALRPFAVGQYRLLASALICSMLSIGIWLVASVWQVIQLGGSPTDLSAVALGASLGLVLSVLIGGAVADRIPQRYILLTVELVRGLCFGAAAILALTDRIAMWQLAVIAFVLGVADGFFFPAYSAWLPSLIEPEQLLAANGIEGVLRPTIMQAAGPALASVIIAVCPLGSRSPWWR